jgi:trehalose-6-phosphate synthase
MGEAIIMNPNNVEEIVDALEKAMSMPEKNKSDEISLQKRLESYDVSKWAMLHKIWWRGGEQKKFNDKIWDRRKKNTG